MPIAAKRDEIKEALLKHQVLIIAGETGSGKTTQLPKICLEIGRRQLRL
ncbi:ATP-dependent helicase HrpA, partial [Pseudomonas savastanoi pv. glycinea str. race 4]